MRSGTWGYIQAAEEILEQTKDQGFGRVAVVSLLIFLQGLC